VPASLPNVIRQYPYRTAGLSLGKLKKKVIHNGPNQPICLIAYDRQSIAWLKQYDRQLKRVSAVCFLVNARSVADSERIRKYVSVPVVPAPVNDLVQRFSLTHYPVLISRHLIEQGVWF
jgi:integrating conjugative element protein (TIGR03765 family)